MAKRQKQYIVPESRQALHELKYEIASELGIIPLQTTSIGYDTEFSSELAAESTKHNHIDWGILTSRETGAVGGRMTARFIESAKHTLFV
jgi:hypothetical protein